MASFTSQRKGGLQKHWRRRSSSTYSKKVEEDVHHISLLYDPVEHLNTEIFEVTKE